MSEETPAGGEEQPAAASSGGGDSPSSDQKTWAMIAHLLGIICCIGALVVWLIKKAEMPFVEDQAKEALNFQITIFIGQLICGLLTFVVIGMFLAVALFIVNVIFCIMAGIAANKGEKYRYPFAIRLIK